MSQRHKSNIRSIVASQYVSLCGPKPGSKAAMQKLKIIDSEHLLGDDWKKAVKKAKTTNDIFKKSSNHNSRSSNSNFKSSSSRSQNQDFLYHGHNTSSHNQKNRRSKIQNSHPNYQTKYHYVPRIRKYQHSR